MKVLEVVRYHLRPWSSRIPSGQAIAEDQMPKPPHITIEFHTGEWRQIAHLVNEKGRGDSELVQQILQSAKDAGIDFEDVVPSESIITPFDIQWNDESGQD